MIRKTLCTLGALVSLAGATGMPAVPARQGPPARIADAAWLAGTWSGGDTTRVEEHWTTAGGGAMLATSRTLRDGRMIAFEFLRIVERNGTLVYIAQPEGRPPTEFALTAIDGSSLTFANPTHDFPTTIRYARRGDDGLEATASDGGATVQRFSFTRARQ